MYVCMYVCIYIYIYVYHTHCGHCTWVMVRSTTTSERAPCKLKLRWHDDAAGLLVPILCELLVRLYISNEGSKRSQGYTERKENL